MDLSYGNNKDQGSGSVGKVFQAWILIPEAMEKLDSGGICF